ncbi:MAG: signal peptidase I [Phycisphaerae bacterium]|jgi:signal peptidase I|nr:signal peptidase I [Phycisphaerae bacterium]
MTTSVDKRQHELSIVRDTVESVWVAIILAFVLRAFMVEAFVIPTGSMAPRLMGEHYDLVCPACGYEYSYRWDTSKQGSVSRRTKTIPKGACCPSCTYRYTTSMAHVNGGDRVLVMKYLYRFTEPKPFDVVVFRNPQSNDNNYIKRLIGLPGETIEIVHGDIFVTPPGKETPEIRRKPDRAQEVMWQIICDNDYRPDPKKLKENGTEVDAPRRWALPDAGDEEKDGSWTETNSGRTFTFKGSSECSYLTFKGARGIVHTPNKTKLSAAEKKSMREAFVPRYGYNQDGGWNGGVDSGTDLCSDIKLSVVIRPGEAKTSVEYILDGMWYSFRAVFDTDGSVKIFRRQRETTLKSGKLRRTDDAPWGDEWAQAKTAPMVAGVGRKVELAHVDCGVKVWIDGEKIIDKDYPITLDDLKKRLAATKDRQEQGISNTPGTPLPAPGARIGVLGGPVELTHLKLMRDVYYMKYLLGRPSSSNQDFFMDYAHDHGMNVGHDNLGWGVEDNPIILRKRDEDPDLDEFFVLGDNSPQSLDSRGWVEAAPSLRLLDSDGKPQYKLGTVPRYNMIGKAMLVYWPSGFRLPLLPGLPIVPDVGRMRLIR